MINQSLAMDRKKVQRYGSLFDTIDFTVTDDLSKNILESKKTNMVIGTLLIGGTNFKLIRYGVNQKNRIREG
jgi:hypothetical protein